MVLPDACYPWQHLLGLGSFLLSWLHVWHVRDDTTNATALKSSCPSVMQNPCASSQPHKSAGFNQSGAHLMQSLGSRRFVVSDKWSKHAVTEAGDTAALHFWVCNDFLCNVPPYCTPKSGAALLASTLSLQARISAWRPWIHPGILLHLRQQIGKHFLLCYSAFIAWRYF